MNLEQDLIDRIKLHLDESVEDLDAPTTARIAAASNKLHVRQHERKIRWLFTRRPFGPGG